MFYPEIPRECLLLSSSDMQEYMKLKNYFQSSKNSRPPLKLSLPGIIDIVDRFVSSPIGGPHDKIKRACACGFLKESNILMLNSKLFANFICSCKSALNSALQINNYIPKKYFEIKPILDHVPGFEQNPDFRLWSFRTIPKQSELYTPTHTKEKTIIKQPYLSNKGVIESPQPLGSPQHQTGRSAFVIPIINMKQNIPASNSNSQEIDFGLDKAEIVNEQFPIINDSFPLLNDEDLNQPFMQTPSFQEGPGNIDYEEPFPIQENWNLDFI